MNRKTDGLRPRRRTVSGLPVHGALPPQGPRVLRRRHRGAWLILTLLLLGMVGGTVVWRLQSSSYLIVHEVRVSGAKGLDPETVAQAAGVRGKLIYRVDTVRAARAVAKLPLVEAAQVRRVWPRSVSIVVQERQPWGTWQIGGTNYLVDQHGIVLDVVAGPAERSVYDLNAEPGLQPGDHVDADAIRLADQVIEELPAALSQQVSRLEYSSEGGLEIVTDRGERARLGDSHGLDYKLAVWQATEAKVGADHMHLIDLRFGDRAYYR